jgi:hypothetical protein
MTGRRCVRPEALDELDPIDPRAQRSRRDLRRVHRAMMSLLILKHAVSRLRLVEMPKRVVELGAGDGTLLLRLAAGLRPRWVGVELTLLDRQRVVDAKTLEGFGRLDWRTTVMREDALEWAKASTAQRYDLCITTLFLHHFRDTELELLLNGVAARTDAFIAIEPRREAFATIGSHLIGLLGTNAITREDAVKSVAAGFTGQEITAAWPNHQNAWWIDEFRALPFSHAFLAAQKGVRVTDP